MSRVAIIGFGREGQALYKYLNRQKPRPEITILDRKLDPNYLNDLERFDIIYRSPGVPYNLPEIQRAIKNGVKFSSGTELFFENAKGKIIGITGTKGKGTTSKLIYKILKNAGYDAYLAGNIGKPSITILNRLNKNSITVLEMSSFQLQDLHYSPEIAVVLGIFPDHMDSHKNFKEYFEAKAQITRFQKKKDTVIYAAGNKYSEKIAKASKGRKIIVRTDKNNLPRIDPDKLKIRGRHNLINVTVASAVAKEFHVSDKIIIKTALNYRGLPFRLENIATINGIKIYNDSASSNPLSTVAAIKAFHEPTIVMMGGKDKNLDFAPVKKALKESSAKLVIIYGENRNKIFKSISGLKPIKMVNGNLENAFTLALSRAKHGDSIVFSPGSTSFDMFIDYQDRGARFNAIVKKLAHRYTSKSKKKQL
jgi:UDP-N-acetylmuramoylalanine--D-glutamate ligase